MSMWDSDRDIPDLKAKVAIVTGGNSGIGKEITRQLARHGATVYMASRTELRARNAIEVLLETYPDIIEKGGKIEFLKLDLADLKSCQAAASEFLKKEERLDIIVNNAGIMTTPYELTKDGFEIQFQANYLGHFAFTYPLIPLLILTSKLPNASVRVVHISSYGHNLATGIKEGVHFDSIESVNRDFGSPSKLYGQSKLANVLFARELQRRLSGYRIWSNSCHPGSVRTELSRGTKKSYPWASAIISLVTFFFLTPYKGGLTPLYLATAREVQEKNYRGHYFEPYAKRTDPSELGQDDQLAESLWTISERVVAEKCGGLA